VRKTLEMRLLPCTCCAAAAHALFFQLWLLLISVPMPTLSYTSNVRLMASNCQISKTTLCFELKTGSDLLTPMTDSCSLGQDSCLAFIVFTPAALPNVPMLLNEEETVGKTTPAPRKVGKPKPMKVTDYDYTDLTNNVAFGDQSIETIEFLMNVCTFSLNHIHFGFSLQRYWLSSNSRFEVDFVKEEVARTHMYTFREFFKGVMNSKRQAKCVQLTLLALTHVDPLKQPPLAVPVDFVHLRYFLYIILGNVQPIFSYEIITIPHIYSFVPYKQAKSMCSKNRRCLAFRSNDYRAQCFARNTCTGFLSWKNNAPLKEDSEEVRCVRPL
jgi:hypothetical protein